MILDLKGVGEVPKMIKTRADGQFSAPVAGSSGDKAPLRKGAATRCISTLFDAGATAPRATPTVAVERTVSVHRPPAAAAARKPGRACAAK
jgi:hypothetical protein